MADRPARRGLDPAGEDGGWGSPMPAEYGSLTSFLPPLDDHSVDDTHGAERRAASRQSPPRERTPRRWRSRRADPPPPPPAPPPRSNGPARSWADPAPAEDGSGSRDGAALRSAPSSNGPSSPWANPAPPTAGATPAARRAAAAGVVADPAAPPARPESRPSRPGGRTPADGEAIATAAAVGSVETRRPRSGEPVSPDDGGDATPSEVRQLSRRRRPRAQWAQSKRTVRHLDIWTVAKVSFIFYVLFFAAVVVASVMLWYIANAVGRDPVDREVSQDALRPEQVHVPSVRGGGLHLCGRRRTGHPRNHRQHPRSPDVQPHQ